MCKILDFERKDNYVISAQNQFEQNQNDSNVGVIDRPDTKKDEKVDHPKMWNVWLLNDDYTPYYVVVEVIILVFGFSEHEAARRMRVAHTTGRAHMGVFTRDVAETKSQQVSSECLRFGRYPLAADIDEAPSP